MPPPRPQPKGAERTQPSLHAVSPGVAGVVPSNLEALIDQTIRDIQTLETQEQLWSHPDPDDHFVEDDSKAERFGPLPPVEVPQPPLIPRARKATGDAEKQRARAEAERRKAVREYLKEACKPTLRPRSPYVAPKLDLLDSEQRRPWENSMESLSLYPLEAKICSQVIW